MKRIISFFLMTVLAMSALTNAFAETNSTTTAADTQEAETEVYENDKLLVLGDSIAFGYGIADDNKKYSNIIARELDFNVKNDAVVGDATSDLLKHIEKEPEIQSDIAEADTIVISIGGNDFLGLRYNFSIKDLADIISNGSNSKVLKKMATDAKHNIMLIHDGIRKLNKDAYIVLQTVYNPFQGRSDTFTTMLCEVVELMRKEFTQSYFAEADTDDKMQIADVEKTFRTYYNEKNVEEIVQSDFVHPSVKGHRMIADDVEEAIDLIHKAKWSTVKKSASSIIRSASRIMS